MRTAVAVARRGRVLKQRSRERRATTTATAARSLRDVHELTWAGSAVTVLDLTRSRDLECGNVLCDVPRGCPCRLATFAERNRDALRGVERLVLAGNDLRALPRSVLSPALFPALRALDASDNGLDELPAELGALTTLEELDVSGNPAIESLPAGALLALPRLARVNVAGLRASAVQPLAAAANRRFELVGGGTREGAIR